MTARARASIGDGKSCRITYHGTGHLHAPLSVPRTPKSRFSEFTAGEVAVIVAALEDFAGIPEGEAIAEALICELDPAPFGGES